MADVVFLKNLYNSKIMKAEEYIDKASTKTFHVKDRICSDNNIKAFAYMAADIRKK